MVAVRSATPADALAIADFNLRMARETESISLDAAVLERGVRAVLGDAGKGSYFVAECSGRMAGQLMITREWSDWRDGDIWWIQSVYVIPEFRRRGVLRALYEHVAARARQENAVGLRLYVHTGNTTAQSTYVRLGMKSANYLVMESMFGREGD